MSTTFGKFRLLQKIGGGRLSQVYRVSRLEGTGPAPKIALKRVHPSVIADPSFVKLVVREAGLLAPLSHAALCSCQEMGVVDGCAFLTLDLVDGCTLRALMRRLSRLQVKLPPSAVIAIGHQLSSVLEYLHHDCALPLVHLDLSPQNVMLSRAGTVKLIDFGIAQRLDGQDPPPLGGRIAGTVGYMSPEQANGAPPDARADQYGLGILLYEMATGRRLFRGNTRESWRRMRNGEINADRALFKDTPLTLQRTVLRMLARRPDDRFVHMREVRDSLEGASSDPQSGQRPLAALVGHLMADDEFDPFDVVQHPSAPEVPHDIPLGETATDGYEELSITVDHGHGTPSSMLRSILDGPHDLPDSPFLESISEIHDAAHRGR